MNTMSGDSRSFRRHCASALTHPVTVAAVVVLLLNDALFKSLWPDSWVTGKLSDLAWMVFASPLLAFVLSLFLGRLPFARRAVVLVSYVGLPALYAAFNTFKPLHDWILRGLSLVAGGTAGSPLDPTDSLVIPLGLGIAVWVWRRRPVSRDYLRVRLALLAAGVATFATVATSYNWEFGIKSLGVAPNGIIVGSQSEESSSHFYSKDGGLTWIPGYRGPIIRWGGSEEETPRGKFRIQDSDILVQTIDGEWTAVYSAAYLQQEANLWIQGQATTHFGMRELGRRPHSIIYDERSGNLIVAVGLQGVLVGTPDSGWSRVAVDHYLPTDFSPLSKALVLIATTSLWTTAISLSASMTAISLVLARYRRETVRLGIGVTVATLVLFIGLPFLWTVFQPNDILLAAISVLPFIAIGIAIFVALVPNDSTTTQGLALSLSIVGIIVSCMTLLPHGGAGAGLDSFLRAVFVIVPILFAIAASRMTWRHLRRRRVVIAAFAGMNGLVILVFLTWVQLDFGLTFAKISAFVLVALVAVALTRHIRREQQPAEDTDKAKTS